MAGPCRMLRQVECAIREAAKKFRLTLMMVAQDQAGQTRIPSKNWLLLSIAGGTRIDLPGRSQFVSQLGLLRDRRSAFSQIGRSSRSDQYRHSGSLFPGRANNWKDIGGTRGPTPVAQMNRLMAFRNSVTICQQFACSSSSQPNSEKRPPSAVRAARQNITLLRSMPQLTRRTIEFA
jgi:hypothetical protein